jgi:hypothetical protein
MSAVTWLIASGSRPGLVHRVVLHPDGLLTCSCEASQYGRLCRHRISVIHEHLQELMTMPFDANDHLENLERDSRKPPRMYLPVRWRLVWLREQAPEAVITTTLLERTDTFALFRAQITLPDGGASATGHGSETKADFGDFIEKAETKSIGRALAALGYGTQFASDLDEGQRIVDSPITPRPASIPLTPANLQQRAWYREAMKRYGFADEDDRLAIAEAIGRGPFDHLTANQLKGIVDAARATLVVKGEDGRWAIAEPVVEPPTIAAELSTTMR